MPDPRDTNSDLLAHVESRDFPSPEEVETDSPPSPPPSEEPPARAAAESPSAKPSEPPKPTTPAAKTPEQTPQQRKAHEDFLAKHGGDPEKGAQHYFEVMTQNARFAKENGALSERLAKLEESISKLSTPAGQDSPAKQAQVEAEAPVLVKRLDQVILDLSQEFGQIEQGLTKVKEVLPQWTSHRDQLISRLESLTDPDQFAQAQQQLRDANRAISQLTSHQESLWRDRSRILRDYNSADLNRQIAQQLHQESQSRASLETTSAEREVKDYRDSFNSTVSRIASAKGISSDDVEDFREQAQQAGYYHLHALDKSIDDMDSFISGLADRFVERQRRVAAGYAAAKVADAKPSAPEGKKAVAPEPPKKSAPRSLEEHFSQVEDAWSAERI